MDDDTKTLIAVLALFYGSSNGIALFRNRLKTVEERTNELKEAIASLATAKKVLKERRGKLMRSLFGPGSLIYVFVVLLLPVFLFLVVKLGPAQALGLLGLSAAAQNNTVNKSHIFFYILFALVLLATWEWLSPYFQGWKTVLASLKKRPGA
jgi:ATP/ADP translocase